MSEKVYEALKRVLANRKGAKAIIVDGYSGFLFLNRDGNPKTAPNYDTMFRLLVKKYNKCHEEALPKVMTPHTLRHTYVKSKTKNKYENFGESTGGTLSKLTDGLS